MAALWAHRRVVLSLVLCLVVALAAAVVLRAHGPWGEQGPGSPSALTSSTPSASPALHDTYSFSVKVLSPAPLHAGEQVTVQWVPKFAGRTSAASGPVPVHCTLALYGPYASMKDSLAAFDAGDGFKPHGAPAFTSLPRTLNDWDAVSQQVEVVLPKTLHAGYYVVVYQCVSSRHSGSGGGAFPIQIGA